VYKYIVNTFHTIKLQLDNKEGRITHTKLSGNGNTLGTFMAGFQKHSSKEGNKAKQSIAGG
jgi:hypothetical protein